MNHISKLIRNMLNSFLVPFLAFNIVLQLKKQFLFYLFNKNKILNKMNKGE